MQIKITDITNYAAEMIRTASSGFIHSVYQHTMNIQTDNGLIALQSPGSVISPISLIASQDLDILNLCSISQGVPVQPGYESIHIMTPRSMTLSWKDAALHDPLLFAQTGKEEICGLSGLLNQVITSGQKGFCQLFAPVSDQNDSPILTIARRRLEDCSRLLSEKSYLPAAVQIAKLIGLGIGLTPSGDDFLCGVLAGLQLMSLKNHPFAHALKKEISSHLSDTNDISAAFLSCALKNMYSQPVLSLASMESPSRILREFSRIGHSSGMDTLCGVYYILTQEHSLIC